MVWVVGSLTLVKSFDKEGLSNRGESGMCKLGMEMYLKTFSKLIVETYKVALALLDQIFIDHSIEVIFIEHFKQT
jgi:hypothetical protein